MREGGPAAPVAWIRTTGHFEHNSERLTPARSATSAAGRGVQVLSERQPGLSGSSLKGSPALSAVQTNASTHAGVLPAAACGELKDAL